VGGTWFCSKAGFGGSGRGGALINAGLGSGGIAGGVLPFRDAVRDGGSTLGISKPRSFKLMSLQAIENSFTSILPSASVSAKALWCSN
jgi:hypothetical protein